MAIAADDTGWSVACARPGDVLRRLGKCTLDEADHARAAGISDETRHEHFIAGRALLRQRLSEQAGDTVQPASWQFVHGACGKPSVRPGLPQIPFSISHAAGLVAVATGPGLQIGIDLELVTDIRSTGPVLDQLTRREQAWLQKHSDAGRWAAFLQLWTAKEAVSKALGLGCGLDFHDIEIDVPAGRARCPGGILDTGDYMNFERHTITALGSTYCLSVACH